MQPINSRSPDRLLSDIATFHSETKRMDDKAGSRAAPISATPTSGADHRHAKRATPRLTPLGFPTAISWRPGTISNQGHTLRMRGPGPGTLPADERRGSLRCRPSIAIPGTAHYRGEREVRAMVGDEPAPRRPRPLRESGQDRYDTAQTTRVSPRMLRIICVCGPPPPWGGNDAAEHLRGRVDPVWRSKQRTHV